MVIIVIMMCVSDFELLFWNLFQINLFRFGFCVSILVVISIIQLMFSDNCKLVKIIGIEVGRMIFCIWFNGFNCSILFIFIRLELMLEIFIVVLISVGYRQYSEMVKVEVINDLENIGLLFMYIVFIIIVIRGNQVSGDIGLKIWISGFIVEYVDLFRLYRIFIGIVMILVIKKFIIIVYKLVYI